MSITTESLVKYNDFIESESPAAVKFKGWKEEAARERQYLYPPRAIFDSEELAELVESFASTPLFKTHAYMCYAPPVAGLTDDDYKEFMLSLNSRAWTTGSFGSRRYEFRDGLRWQAVAVAARTTFKSEGHYDSMSYIFRNLLEEEFTPRKGKTPPVVAELNYLNEFLASDFTGSLKDFIAQPHSDELKKRIELYEFKAYDHTNSVVRHGAHKGVASFHRGVKKATRDLLFALPKDHWNLIVEEAHSYNKGKTHEHTVEFLKDVAAKLDPSLKEATLSYSPLELKKRMTLTLAQSAVDAPSAMDPKKLYLLMKTGMKLIPRDETLKRYGAEYTNILTLIEDRNLDLRQYVGLLVALFYPRTWIRGNGENGIFVLTAMLEADKTSACIDLLTEIILTVECEVPTEAEWRRSLEAHDYASPASWFLALTMTPEALERTTVKMVTEEVVELRRGMK